MCRLSYCRAEDNRLSRLFSTFDQADERFEHRNITRQNEINALFAISRNEASPRSHHRRTLIHVQLLSRWVKWNEKMGRASYRNGGGLMDDAVLHGPHRRIHAN